MWNAREMHVKVVKCTWKWCISWTIRWTDFLNKKIKTELAQKEKCGVLFRSNETQGRTESWQSRTKSTKKKETSKAIILPQCMQRTNEDTKERVTEEENSSRECVSMCRKHGKKRGRNDVVTWKSVVTWSFYNGSERTTILTLAMLPINPFTAMMSLENGQ